MSERLKHYSYVKGAQVNMSKNMMLIMVLVIHLFRRVQSLTVKNMMLTAVLG